MRLLIFIKPPTLLIIVFDLLVIYVKVLQAYCYMLTGCKLETISVYVRWLITWSYTSQLHVDMWHGIDLAVVLRSEEVARGRSRGGHAPPERDTDSAAYLPTITTKRAFLPTFPSTPYHYHVKAQTSLICFDQCVQTLRFSVLLYSFRS